MLLNKATKLNIADTLVAFVLFAECNTIYSYSNILNRQLFLIGCVVAILGAIVIRLATSKPTLSINKCLVVGLLYYSIGSFHFFIVEREQLFQYVFRFFINLPLLVVYFATIGGTEKNKYSVLYRFSDIVFIFALVSIFFWYFGEISGIIQRTSKIIVDWNISQVVDGWYNLHAGMQGWRNCGVFTEAPMYNIVICTAVLVEYYFRENINKIRIAVLIIANLTTMSTTGQVVLILASFHRFIIFNWRTLSTFVKLVLLTFFSFFVTGVSYATYLILMMKIGGDSYNVRLAFIKKAIDTWLTSPLFGVGFGMNSAGSSNSLFTILADGGLLLVSIYIYAMIVMPLYRKMKLGWNYWNFSFFYFLMFIITIVPYNFITFAIMAAPLSLYIQKRIEK